MDRIEVNSVFDALGSAFSASMEIWLVVIYLLCMFLVTTFRPQQIGSVGLYRFSYILFAFYLLIPTVVRMILAIVSANRRDLGRALQPTYSELVLIPLFMGISRILLALAILCGMASLRHHQRRDLPPVLDDE